MGSRIHEIKLAIGNGMDEDTISEMTGGKKCKVIKFHVFMQTSEKYNLNICKLLLLVVILQRNLWNKKEARLTTTNYGNNG